jgi:hypothetical protein
MLANLHTLNQRTKARIDEVCGLDLVTALAMARARCASRCEGEQPHKEVIAGQGVTYRNHTDYVEVVTFVQHAQARSAA